MSQDTTKKHSSGGRLSLSRSPAPIQVGNTRATCRGIVNKGTAHSSAHKHMTRMYLLNLFGGLGFVAKATNHVCLRVFVLGTQEGRDKAPCSHQNSSGPLRKMCLRNDFTSSCSSKVNPPRLPSLTCFNVFACLGFWNTHVIRGCGTCRKMQARAAQPRMVWVLADICFFDYQARSERGFRLEPRTTAVLLASVLETCGRCSVSGQKHVHPKASASRSECCLSRFPLFSPQRTTIPEKTSFDWNGIFTQRVNRYWYGSY